MLLLRPSTMFFQNYIHYFRNATYENLQYLTIEQSLADIALFINEIKSKLNVTENNVTVFAWGSGYGGTLAALARQTYPHLVHGVWSSNGIFQPIVFNTGKVVIRFHL